MQRNSGSPVSLAKSFWHNRGLIKALVKRDVLGRYKGSFLGIVWSFFNPVFMLLVYTFMFSVVFKSRWPGGSESKTQFAIILFAGLMVFNLFAEVINRAPSLIPANANYVKKVIFPLEILPVVALGAALFHFLISMSVWLLFYLIFLGIPPATALLLPIIVFPLLLLTLGITWILASLGVFLRDVGQVISILTMALMFLSPIFYPISALPAQYQEFMVMNPMTPVVEAVRNALIWGQAPDWMLYGAYTLIAAVIAWVGFAWFQKMRKGFADVL